MGRYSKTQMLREREARKEALKVKEKTSVKKDKPSRAGSRGPKPTPAKDLVIENRAILNELGWGGIVEKLLIELDFLYTSGLRRAQIDRRELNILALDKHTIEQSVENQMKEVRKRFPQVKKTDLVELVDSIIIKKLKKITASNKYVDLIIRGDGSRDLVARNSRSQENPTSQFAKLQEVMTKLKSELRQSAYHALQRSAKDIKNQRIAAAALVVTGTDVRSTQEGGDIQEDYTSEDGRFLLTSKDISTPTKKNADKTTSVNNLLNSPAQKRKTGFQLGHAFGPGIANLAAFIDKTPDPERQNEQPLFTLFQDTIYLKSLPKLREAAVRIDGDEDFEITVAARNNTQVGVNVAVVTLQDVASNKSGGTSLQNLKIPERVLKRLEKRLRKIIEEGVRYYPGSDPLLDQLVDRYIDMFFGIPPKNIKIKGKGKITARSPIKIPVYRMQLTPGKNKGGLPPKERKTSDLAPPDLNSLLGLLNAEMHDKVRENMGKGNSKKQLNYRTGKFARSARIKTLFDIPEKGAIGATVGYRRNPYAVFEKGQSRLATGPGRDPALIFGRSIRQILQEQGIANLRRVKVDLENG